MPHGAILDGLAEEIAAIIARKGMQSLGGGGAPGGAGYGAAMGMGGAGGAAWQAFQKALPSGTPSLPYYTGPGGLFGVAGLERDIISTRVEARGIASLIPAVGSLVDTPLFPYLTGFEVGSGAEKDGVCDDPPVAGPGKVCIQTAQFGRYERQTREFEVNRVGLQINRGEFQDLRLVNPPILMDNSALTPVGLPLYRETMMRFVELGIDLQNLLTRQVYRGNPANNSAGGGYKEFPGLDILIGTNKVDAVSGNACPSLDSDIKNFNYAHVDSQGGDTLINVMAYLFRTLRHNASRMNMEPVSWVITMRQELFYELTAVWPCSYLTYRCNFRAADGTMHVNVSATDQVAMRDAMRQGNYLIIDGMVIPVITDDAIVEEGAPDVGAIDDGCFASDIYVLPTVVRGGLAVLYWEYLDYSQGAMQVVEDGPMAGQYFWSDGGRYLWHMKPPNNWCVQWITKIEPRLILRTPHLAGRITNVQYCPLQHTRDPYPDDPYFVDGGWSGPRPTTALYSDWSLP